MIYIDEIPALVIESYLNNPRDTLGFLGPVGAGKSEAVVQASEELRKLTGNPDFFLATVILSQMSEEDFMIPWPEAELAKQGVYKHLTHGNWVFPKDAAGIIFLDEALNGSDGVKKSVQNILSSFSINGHPLPEKVMILVASNRKEDRAGVTSINTAFGNRVEWHEVDIRFSGWEHWAIQCNIDQSVITFLKKFPQHMYDFKNDRLINATPRTWAKTSHVLGSKWELQRISGLVGEGIATEFLTFRALFGEFPEIEEIRRNPAKAKMPASLDAQFALANALAMWTTRDHWVDFVKYAERMNNEYKFMYMREAARLHPDFGLKATQPWIDYILTNQKDLI